MLGGRRRCTRHAVGGVGGGGRYRCSAVPVLDAICTPGGIAPPFCWVICSAPIIKSVSLAATCVDTARRCWAGAAVLMLDRSGALEAVHQVGLHHHTGIGDRRRHQRVLQRCHRHVFLAHARHPPGRRRRRSGRWSTPPPPTGSALVGCRTRTPARCCAGRQHPPAYPIRRTRYCRSGRTPPAATRWERCRMACRRSSPTSPCCWATGSAGALVS